MKIHSLVVAAVVMFSCALSHGGTVYVANGSFESPDTPFADPRIDSWQDNPKPDWYDESGGFTWDQLTGVFENTAPGESNHIDNVHGSQAAFLLNVPQVGISQDLAAYFRVGRSYRLTLGLIGGGGGMLEGTPLSVSLYYRDSASNVVTVASTNIVHTAAVFSNNTHFIDFTLRLPTVRASDTWEGEYIGIAINSGVINPLLAGGYWDIDNVRLTETIDVPNGSFESPDTPFADPRIDSWQENPKPVWYDESGGFLWDYLTGVFENTAPGESNHIHNIHGSQGMFLFNLPQVGVFQDYESTDWIHPTPTHDFDVRFEPGRIYKLTVGVIGGGGGMPEGASLGIGLYYGTSNIVAMTNVVHSLALFPDTTNFVDISVSTPMVKDTDPWARQRMGIQLFSTIGFELQGGYWDLDNVRLEEIRPLRLRTHRVGEIIVEGEPGTTINILASTSLTTPIANWVVVGTVSNVTGTATFVDPSPGKGQRFYIARYAP